MKLVYVGEKTQYTVELKAILPNVIEVSGNYPMKEKGFDIICDDGSVLDYRAYSTLYRTIQTGVYQFSNDGTHWEEPTHDIVVSVTWMDDEDYEELRPESVDVTVKFGDETVEVLTLSSETEWKKTYPNLPMSVSYTVEADDVDNYNMEITGTTVTYKMEKPLEPTISEQLAEIQDMLIDLDERVYNLEGGNE